MEKINGIVRRVDDLGRIVIPKELRKNLKIDIGTPMEIFTKGSEIILKKYKTKACNNCKHTLDEGDKYCSNCGKKVDVDDN